MSSTEELFARYGAPYRWFATLTALIAAVSVILSATIVNVAIPEVMGAFGIDQTKAQWLSTGFLGAMTATMLLTDWTERALGQRGAVSAALTLFTLGSVLGGMAPDENVLILARVVQGAAAGIVQPLAMVIIFQVFPPEKRGAAMGIYGIGVVLAPALGPWVGGLLMDSFNWRYIFYLGVPFAGLGVLLANIFLPARAESGPRPGFDWPGFGLLALFLMTLLTALSSGQRAGWSSDTVLAELLVSVVALVGFIEWERRTSRPMLDLRLFMNVPFACACLVSFVLGAGLFGSTYLLPVFVQTIQGMTPTQAGLLLMPAGLAMVLIFPLAGRLSDQFSPGILIGIGLVIFALASYLTAFANVHTSFWTLARWTVLSRIGMGLVFPALSAGALRVLPMSLVAQGSGGINFARQLGGAFGVNLLAVVLERATAFHADMLTATQTPDNSATTTLLVQVAQLAQLTGSANLPDFQQNPVGMSYLGQAIYLQANTLAYHDGFLITAILFVLALIPTWLLSRARHG